MQLKVEIRHMFFSNIYNGRKESKKIVGKIKDKGMRKMEKFLSYLEVHIIGDGKSFYMLSKLLLLIFPLMNINGTHK